MGLAFAWIGTFLSLTALGWAVLGGIRLYRRLHRAFSERRRPAPALLAPASAAPIEQLGANLCRLRAKLETAENEALTPYKAARVRALRGAYVDVLSAACERLEVPPPAARGGGTVPLAEIYRAEVALRDRGLDVRA